MVVGIHEVAQEVVKKLLREFASLHVGLHVDFGHVEPVVFEHALHGNDVGMALAPRQGLHGSVNDVHSVFGKLQNASHLQPRAAMAMVFHDYVGVVFLNKATKLSEQGWLTYSCHVFQAYFGSTGCNELVGNGTVVFGRVDGRISDAERGLRCHAGLEGPLDGGNDVAHIVQATKNAGYVHTLSVLHLVLQPTQIGRTREHAQGVQAAVKHVGLNTSLMVDLRHGTHGLIRILAIEQIHLLKGSTVCFHSGKAAHLHYHWGYAFQLVLARLKFSIALKHVSIDETELYFSSHNSMLKAHSLTGGSRKIDAKLRKKPQVSAFSKKIVGFELFFAAAPRST